jgi:hypothetical protein
MVAMVARTGRTGRMETSGWRAVRVTHALLFLSAMMLSPGVCAACGTGCCNGFSHAVADGTTAGTASSVAATHCCGSPTGPSCSVADAGDGDQNNGSCRCALERRSITAATVGRGSEESRGMRVLLTAAAAWVCRPGDPLAGRPVGDREALLAALSIPTRPVRVLLRVWRI